MLYKKPPLSKEEKKYAKYNSFLFSFSWNNKCLKICNKNKNRYVISIIYNMYKVRIKKKTNKIYKK